MNNKVKKDFNISLILSALKDLEKVYIDMKKLLKIPHSEFTSNKLIIDKVRSDFNMAFESLMRVCRHITQVLGMTRISGKECLYQLAIAVGSENPERFSELSQFYFNNRDMKKDVDPLYLYSFLKENTDLFKVIAGDIVRFIKEKTGNYLLIDFSMLRQKYFFIKDSVKKIEFVISQGKEEFMNKPMYYDRSRYFFIVAYDSLFDICSHLAPKFGIKRFGEDCLLKMVESNIIDKRYEQDIKELIKLRNTLAESWDVDKEKMFESFNKLKDKLLPITKQIFNHLEKLLKSFKKP